METPQHRTPYACVASDCAGAGTGTQADTAAAEAHRCRATSPQDSFHRLREGFKFSFIASSSFQTPSKTEDREKIKDPNYIHVQSQE